MTPSVMQYPLYTAVPFQHHTHKPQLVQGVALLCLFGFLPDGTSGRDVPVLWGSEPTAHTWAGKAEWLAANCEKGFKRHKCPLCSADTGLGWAGAPGSPQLSLPSSLSQLLEELWLHWGQSKTPPSPATSPLLQPSHAAAAFKLMLLWWIKT